MTELFGGTGGMDTQEYEVYSLIKYDLLNNPDFENKKFEVTNALHLLQTVFMWRVIIRLNKGNFWVRYNLPYETYCKLKPLPKSEKYRKVVNDLLKFREKFINLEPYHPSHLDDVTRGINSLFDLIKEYEQQKYGNQTIF